jgi:hypothetical protein
MPDADAENRSGKSRVSSACPAATAAGSCCQTLRMPVAIVIVLVRSRYGRASAVDGLLPIQNTE